MRWGDPQDAKLLHRILLGLVCFLVALALGLGHLRLYELETEQTELQNTLAELELQRGNLQKEARRSASALAREYGMVPLDPQEVTVLHIGRDP